MVVSHLGRLEGRVLHMLAGQRLEAATGNVGRPHALLLLLLELRGPGACLLGALLRLLQRCRLSGPDAASSSHRHPARVGLRGARVWRPTVVAAPRASVHVSQ